MKLRVQFVEKEKRLSVLFNKSETEFDVSLGDFQTVTKYVGGDPYTGDYVVTPKVEEQTMETKEKVMLEDVTILAIPYYVTGNISGGDTVYIAKEVK